MKYQDDNIFAKILRNEIPAEKVYENEDTLVIMDIMPRVEGHVLVIPKTPARNMLDATPTQLAGCLATVQRVSQAALVAFEAQGITLQQFNEVASGQEVFHLHFHVLPRQDGDKLRPPGTMADSAVLAGNAKKLRAALEQMS